MEDCKSMYDNSPAAALVKRGNLCLEDSDWEKAKEFFNNALNLDPENPTAYIGSLLAGLRLSSEQQLSSCKKLYGDNPDYKKALRFANEEYASVLRSYCNENAYLTAGDLLNSNDFNKIVEAKAVYESLSEYSDCSEKLAQCKEKIDELVLRRAQKKAKIKKISLAVFALLVVATVSTVSIRAASCKKEAAKLYNMMLGKTFSAEFKDDQGFATDYINNALKNKPYYEYKLECTLTFNSDGTVTEDKRSSCSLCAAPKAYYSEYEKYEYDIPSHYEYSSFRIRVSFFGKQYIKIGSEEYQCGVYAIEHYSLGFYQFGNIYRDLKSSR